MALVAINVVVSVLLATPIVHYTTLRVIDPPDLGVRRMVLCVERWNSASVRRAYSVFAFVIQFCLPLFATAVLYTRIYARLRLRRRRALSGRLRNSSSAAALNPFRRCPSLTSEQVTTEPARSSSPAVGGPNVASRTNKTNRILAAIVVNFVVCWTGKSSRERYKSSVDGYIITGHWTGKSSSDRKVIIRTGKSSLDVGR